MPRTMKTTTSMSAGYYSSGYGAIDDRPVSLPVEPASFFADVPPTRRSRCR